MLQNIHSLRTQMGIDVHRPHDGLARRARVHRQPFDTPASAPFHPKTPV
jgi:hypothetical protein